MKPLKVSFSHFFFYSQYYTLFSVLTEQLFDLHVLEDYISMKEFNHVIIPQMFNV